MTTHTRKNRVGVSVREASRQLGVSDTAIHKAVADGRCWKHPDGSVDVEAIRAGMSLTANIGHGGKRQAGVYGEAPVPAVAPGSGVQTPAQAPAEPHQAASLAHKPLLAAKTLTEQAKAEREQIELAKLKQQVAEIEPMVRAVVDAMTAARGEVLALPDRLTPMVTPETDPAKVYSICEAETTRICTDLQHKLQQLAERYQATVTVTV